VPRPNGWLVGIFGSNGEPLRHFILEAATQSRSLIRQPARSSPATRSPRPSSRGPNRRRSIKFKRFSISNPTPNVSGNNTYNRQDPLSSTHPRTEYIGCVDYQITPSERIFARYINNQDMQTGPLGSFGLECSGSLQFVGGCTDKQPGWNLSVDLTSTLTPTLLNEVTVGPSVYRSDVEGVNGNITVGANDINLPLLYPVSNNTSIPDFNFSGNGQNYPSTYLGAPPLASGDDDDLRQRQPNVEPARSHNDFRRLLSAQPQRSDQLRQLERSVQLQ
jgi:hypothetical protein